MSVSDSLEEEKLGVQIKVSPELIKSLLDKGLSPAKVLTRLIEKLSPEDLVDAYDTNKETFDLVLEESSQKYNIGNWSGDSKTVDFLGDIAKTRKPDEEKYINLEWESHYPDGTITDPKIKCPKCGVSSTKKNPTFPSPWNRCRVCVYWKEHQFDLYIQRLVDEAESENQLREPDDGMDETGYATLVALLVAYSEQPNPNPTSKQLIAARFENDYLTTLKDLYPNFTDIWREELRTSKARLTIEAKNMGFHTGPFRPSYGSGKKRKHPMYPSLHKQLREWFNPEELPGKTPLSDKEYLRKLNEFKQKRLRFKMKYGKNIHIPSSRLHRFEESD